MKEALQRAFARQAEQAKAKPVAPAKTTPAKKTAPAPRKAATAAPTARHWGLPDPGHEYRVPAPAPAPKAKQSGLDTKMVARLARITKQSLN